MGKKKESLPSIIKEPVLLEKFCQHYSQYENRTQAYLFARGDKRIDKNGVTYDSAKELGHRMMQVPEVKERIAQIQEELAVQYNQTKDNNIRDLINSAEEAKAQGQFGAYAKLRDMVIRLCGLYPSDKQEITHKLITFNYVKPDDKK